MRQLLCLLRELFGLHGSRARACLHETRLAEQRAMKAEQRLDTADLELLERAQHAPACVLAVDAVDDELREQRVVERRHLGPCLEIPKDADLAEDVIRQNRVRTLDVARVRSEGVGEKYFINVATGGLGAEISDANEGEFKKRWGKLSYLRASLEVAKDFDVRELDLSLDGELRKVRAVNVVVGNCRYAGGGWLAAPKANPEDGLLDVVIIETLGVADLLELAPASLMRNSYLDKDGVFFARAKEILVKTQPPGLEFTTDGEVIGDEPAEFSVVPHALKVIVGPEYVAEPQG